MRTLGVTARRGESSPHPLLPAMPMGRGTGAHREGLVTSYGAPLRRGEVVVRLPVLLEGPGAVWAPGSKLYLPPGERRFGCRRCHSLTYKSSQESHRYDWLCALLTGEDSGEAFDAVRRVFLAKSREAQARATREPCGPLEAFDGRQWHDLP